MRIVANFPIGYNPESQRIYAQVHSHNYTWLFQTLFGSLYDILDRGEQGGEQEEESSLGAYVHVLLYLLLIIH